MYNIKRYLKSCKLTKKQLRKRVNYRELNLLVPIINCWTDSKIALFSLIDEFGFPYNNVSKWIYNNIDPYTWNDLFKRHITIQSCRVLLVIIKKSLINISERYICKPGKKYTISAGLEPAISWFVVRRLIHWATRPLY